MSRRDLSRSKWGEPEWREAYEEILSNSLEEGENVTDVVSFAFTIGLCVRSLVPNFHAPIPSMDPLLPLISLTWWPFKPSVSEELHYQLVNRRRRWSEGAHVRFLSREFSEYFGEKPIERANMKFDDREYLISTAMLSGQSDFMDFDYLVRHPDRFDHYLNDLIQRTQDL